MISNGLEPGEMNIKLLRKIEELTLYMIEMNKRMGQLEAENAEFKMSNQELGKRFNSLKINNMIITGVMINHY